MSEAASQNQRAAQEPTRLNVADARRWVIKIGSAVLTDNGQGLSETFIRQLGQDVVSLRARGCEVILVSSGAVAAGLARLGISERPSALDELQAAAAVGNLRLYKLTKRPSHLLASSAHKFCSATMTLNLAIVT